MMDDQAKSRSLRSDESFNIKFDCLFCANYAKSDKKKRGGMYGMSKLLTFKKL